jgi:hypothetical protein
MKKMFTTQRVAYAFGCFLFMLYGLTLNAQTRCGFAAQVTNGSIINLCTGSSVALNAQPTGAGYSYQWQIQTTAGGPFTNVSGATGASYNTSALAAYRVLVKNGSCTDTSGIANLVHFDVQAGTITGGPSGKVCVGENAGTLTGTSVPGGDLGILKYQWEKNDNNTGWVEINGANDVNYSVGIINNTTAYRRSVSDNCGNKAYSNIITLTIASPIVPGAINPLTQTISAGGTAATLNSTTASSGGSGNLKYQWRSSPFARGPFTDIVGANAASYSPGVLNQTTYFERTTIDVQCNTSASTDPAVVFVNGGILNAGYFTTNSSCFFAGGSTTPLTTAVEPTGGTAPYTVEWQLSTDNVNFTTIPGANGSIYQPGTLARSTYFRKKVTDAAGHVAFSPSELISFVSTALSGGTINATSSVACLGSSPAPILSLKSASGFGEKLSYQWQYKTASGNWVDIAGQIRDNLIPEPITEQTTFRRIAIDACGTNTRQAISNEVTIDIRPALNAGSIRPTAQTIGSGGTPLALNSTEDPSGGTGSYTITWENSSLAVGPFGQIGGASSVNYQPPSLTQTTYYRRSVKDNNCLATKYTYVVEVSVVQGGPIVGGILAGSTCVFPGNRPGKISTSHLRLVSGGVTPYNFQWEQRVGNTGPFAVIPGATSESFQPPVITETYQYRRRVTDAVGTFAYSDTITVEYHTAPLNAGSIAATTSTLLCGGGTPGLIVSTNSLSGFGESAHYQWQMRTETGNWTDIADAIRDNYQPGPITEKTYFRRVGSDQCSGVTRTVISNEVVFDLAPKITLKAGLVDGPFITCSGTAPGVIRSVLDACGTGNVSYQWEINNGSGWTTISGATAASYIPKPINGGTLYRRKVSDGCGQSGYSNEVMIYVYPPLEPGIIGTETQKVCINQTPDKIKLLTNCHYTDGTVTYQWESSPSAGGPWTSIGGATTGEYQPQKAGTSMYYRLKVMSTTCSMFAYTNVASVILDNSCSVVGGVTNPGITSDDMQVYPNPLTGNIITVKVNTTGAVNATLQSAEGTLVPSRVSQAGSGMLKVTTTGGILPQGTYMLTIYSGGERHTKKIIVQ